MNWKRSRTFKYARIVLRSTMVSTTHRFIILTPFLVLTRPFIAFIYPSLDTKLEKQNSLYVTRDVYRLLVSHLCPPPPASNTFWLLRHIVSNVKAIGVALKKYFSQDRSVRECFKTEDFWFELVNKKSWNFNTFVYLKHIFVSEDEWRLMFRWYKIRG